jgi:hypothetical protein
VGNRLIAVEKWHVTEIDFPVEVAGRAGIVGVVGRAALSKYGSSSKAKDKGQDEKQHFPGLQGRRLAVGAHLLYSSLSLIINCLHPSQL